MRLIEAAVGLLILGALSAFLVLAFKVSGLTVHQGSQTYEVTAHFDNIGGLKIRAPVTIAGVKVGQVQKISLDPQTFKAAVTITMMARTTEVPADSQASIVTSGLLGAHYIELTPGFSENFLNEGSRIFDTQSALQLETMIGQLLFNINKQEKTPVPEVS
jgi:phospholipid/cholesterol/gamma-HCH transport system substrate-binding protein